MAACVGAGHAGAATIVDFGSGIAPDQSLQAGYYFEDGFSVGFYQKGSPEPYNHVPWNWWRYPWAGLYDFNTIVVRSTDKTMFDPISMEIDNLTGRTIEIEVLFRILGGQIRKTYQVMPGLNERVVFDFWRPVIDLEIMGPYGATIDEMELAHTAISAVPEAATWATLIAGFGIAGTVIRRKRRRLAAA